MQKQGEWGGGHLFTYWTPCLPPDQPNPHGLNPRVQLVSAPLKCPQHTLTREAGRLYSPVSRSPATSLMPGWVAFGPTAPPGRGLLDFGGSEVLETRTWDCWAGPAWCLGAGADPRGRAGLRSGPGRARRGGQSLWGQEVPRVGGRLLLLCSVWSRLCYQNLRQARDAHCSQQGWGSSRRPFKLRQPLHCGESRSDFGLEC